jgi:hypothetical protein
MQFNRDLFRSITSNLGIDFCRPASNDAPNATNARGADDARQIHLAAQWR